MLLDIVILPPRKLRNKIGKFTTNLKKRIPHLWKVDNKKLIPHVSLFHLQIKKDGFKDVVEFVEIVAKKHKALVLSFTKPEFIGVYYGINIKNIRPLNKIHRAVVFGTRNFRTGQMPLVHSPKSKLAKKYIKEFGAPGVLRNFNPHITLGGVKNLKNTETVVKAAISKRKFSTFLADTIAIALVNNYWQVTKILKKFKLK